MLADTRPLRSMRSEQRPNIQRWIQTVQSRLAISLVIVALAAFSSAFGKARVLIVAISVYVASAFALAVLATAASNWRRVRAIAILLDVAIVTVAVVTSGGRDSIWSLLYFFPILSSSRALGPSWSFVTATFSAISYGVACLSVQGAQALLTLEFAVRGAAFFGVAISARKLARTRNDAESDLTSTLEGFDRKVLAGANVQDVMLLTSRTALELTGSDIAGIVLVNGTESFVERPSTEKHPLDIARAKQTLREHFVRAVVAPVAYALPEQLTVSRALAALLPTKSNPDDWSARLVPIKAGHNVLGVIGVFSRRQTHYTPDDIRKLSGFAPAIAVAQVRAEQYVEMRARIAALYNISEHLNAEEGLGQIFANVVRLVVERIGCEEAALFLPEDAARAADPPLLEKVASFATDTTLTEALPNTDLRYEHASSLTGRVFASKRALRLNKLPDNEANAAAYAALLPSRQVRHYMGVPLLIGAEVLGVIRVLNKRAPEYRPLATKAFLDPAGFTDDDLHLLTIVATQAASAIRHAKFLQQNHDLRRFLENSPDPTIVVDASGIIKVFNRECESLWGIRAADAVDTSVANYYESPEHAKEIGRALWDAPDHHLRDYPARIRRHDDPSIPIRLNAVLFPAEGVSIGVFTDERATRRLEEERLRAAKLAVVGHVAQRTGHDIKHDLSAIRMYADGLARSNQTTEVAEACSAIVAATEDALEKIVNMLVAAKAQPLHLEIATVGSVLSTFRSSIDRWAAETDIQLIVDWPPSDILIAVDTEQMQQVFRNLFGNSLDAIQAVRDLQGDDFPGIVNLTANIRDRVVEISWCDNGIGMSDATMRDLFAAFFTTKGDAGTGLGLHITQWILAQHSGTIVAEQREGGGACFRIHLPIAQPGAHLPTNELS
jgi:PAS domain S-box-containing protein